MLMVNILALAPNECTTASNIDPLLNREQNWEERILHYTGPHFS